MKKIYNTYYNIINDESELPTKSPILTGSPQVNKKPQTKVEAAISNITDSGIGGKNSALMCIGVGMLAGLLISIATKKNFILNPLIGGAIGYAGDAFILKGKSTKKTKIG